MIHLPGHGVLPGADAQLTGCRVEAGLLLFVPQVAQKACHAFFEPREQIGEPGRILRQITLCIFVHQQAGKACHGIIVQLQKWGQPGAGIIRIRVRVQRHLQHPVHQGAALVGRKLGPSAGLQAQHILQKIAVTAGIVFFQLAGRDAQPLPQQAAQRGQVVHLPGRVLLHALQQRKAPGCIRLRQTQRLSQAGAFHVGQRPAAQRIQCIGGGGCKVGKLQLRCRRVQGFHDGFQRCAQGLALPLGPAEPQPLCRCGEGFVNAHLLAHHAVLKAVRQIDLLCHQNIAVGVGQKARLGRCTGKFALRKAQHEHIVRRVQTHFARACQHHGIQRLWDVPKVRRAQQQAEQVLIFCKGHTLPAQQVGHLVEQLHHHVPLAGRFLCRRDAPGSADGFHQRCLLLFCTQLFQAEIQFPADLFGAAAPHLAAQFVHGCYQQLAGSLGILQRFCILIGQFIFAESLGAFLKFCAPCRRIG